MPTFLGCSWGDNVALTCLSHCKVPTRAISSSLRQRQAGTWVKQPMLCCGSGSCPTGAAPLPTPLGAGSGHSSPSPFPSNPHPGWHSPGRSKHAVEWAGQVASDLGLRSHPADPLPRPQDAPSPPQMKRLVLLVSVLAVVAIATVGSAATGFPRLGRLPSSPAAHRQLAATCQGERATAMLTSLAAVGCDAHRGHLEPSLCSPTAPLLPHT